MIYVKRNADTIPPEILAKAVEAQRKLNSLPKGKRAAYIRKNFKIWTAFRESLSAMSYGKCWYSESPETQSLLDIDHFRPKLEARRSETVLDSEGYEWLAFSWDNFRLAAQRSNRKSKNESTKETEGKGSWFPLLPGSPQATWVNRCEDTEKPILLDPTVRSDVDLIDIDADGRVCCSRFCTGSARTRVDLSIKLYGLNLPKLVGARKRVMREVQDNYKGLIEKILVSNTVPSSADLLSITVPIEQLRRATLPCSPYSKAARAQLKSQPGGADICAQPEDTCCGNITNCIRL